ncbi:hypothetical protein ZYGR_0A02540 [Zygosaccharomyces rouxii]|uniref:Thioredoxin domain-containing protein n=1 Tax=Zygosaccharomyces rouxii TaxID=4956 RepID=A0A1Q2ZT72_ZYGRO|nr:hypothetical protein ZYGR_0A02540 [Zygosaccharomyces rouxii]
MIKMWVFKVLIFFMIQCSNLVWAQNFYDEDPHLIELTPKNFDKVIHRTNYTSVVEFYAPWCGYCKQLKPVMKKVAKKLDGIVQVASVNCDLPKNKQLCAEHRIQGFPTLMVFRPPKIDMSKPHSQRVELRNHAGEVYKGERKMAPIIDFAVSRMKNYVKRLLSVNKLEEIFKKSTRPSMVLFSKKDKLSPVYKSIALDWLGVFNCFIIPNGKLDSLSSDDNLAKSYPNIYGFLQSIAHDQKNSEKSLLVVFDSHNDQYHVFQGDSLVKPQVSKFLTGSIGRNPQEGPGSKRQQFVDAVKSGKNKRVNHDEL